MTDVRLFHFSEDPGIEVFMPRPVRTPTPRADGRDWLNGPLVWAIDEPHQAMYLFPRDCPRILLWPLDTTTPEDLATWWAGRSCRMIAHVERVWFERLSRASIHRYELPSETFESLDDAGMWVSRETVTPIAVEVIEDLIEALQNQGVELRLMESLTPLRDVWSSTVHASGIRLRNAEG